MLQRRLLCPVSGTPIPQRLHFLAGPSRPFFCCLILMPPPLCFAFREVFSCCDFTAVIPFDGQSGLHICYLFQLPDITCFTTEPKSLSSCTILYPILSISSISTTSSISREDTLSITWLCSFLLNGSFLTFSIAVLTDGGQKQRLKVT